MDTIQIISVAIFAVTFFFILTERIHRTVIGLAGAVAMLIAGIAFHFYEPHEAIAAVDFNTLGLLFGMMVIVAILEETGVFQALGIWTAKKTRGSPWYLMLGLGLLTSVLSMILDNVTTIILIVPVTIIVARVLGINPAPILLAEAILSNVGGTGTLIGDPPNIMIGSAAGFSFNDFLMHTLPVVLVAWIATVFVLRWLFKDELAKKPRSIDELLKMDEREAITDWPTLTKTLWVLGFTVILFFLHGALHLDAAVVALIGASLALLLVHATKDPQPVLQRTELSVLLFFGALFVIVGGLEHAGVLELLAAAISSGAADNLLLTALVVLWASAILSAIVDNIPMTVAMIPIIGFLAAEGIEVNLLWWALALGVGFGGNITPIGSTAGIIVTSKSEQTDDPISFKRWLATGTPAAFTGLTIASIFLIIYHQSGYVTGGSFVEGTMEGMHGAPVEEQVEAPIDDPVTEPGTEESIVR